MQDPRQLEAHTVDLKKSELQQEGELKLFYNTGQKVSLTITVTGEMQRKVTKHTHTSPKSSLRMKILLSQ